MAIPIINLSILNGGNGFRMEGFAADNASRGSVSNAGDVNGDGFDDVIVGAYKADPNGRYSGSSYVVFGKAAGFDAGINLSSLDGDNGFRLNGDKYSSAGISVSNAGDVNGDGFDDVIVGALDNDYVVFGKASGFDATLSLSDLDGKSGFRLNGTAVDGFTRGSVSTAGDVNGDDFDDLIVGASYANLNGTQAGASFVVFGKASDFNAVVNLSNLDGNNGFRLDGATPYDRAGTSVSDAGDVNGDGFDDLIVGATYADGNGDGSGASYVVFGKASGFDAAMNLSGLDGSDGFRLDGVAEGDRSGLSVSTAGDVNGDGFDDVIVGAAFADPNDSSFLNFAGPGASYVVFGKASGFDAAITLSSLNGSNGFRLDGVAEYDLSGKSVSTAGDVNGDGFDDLIIGAADADPNASSNYNSSAPGASYVMFGKASGFAAAINLSSLNGGNGFRLDGVAANDHSGKSVSTAGDVNADGFDDLIVGAIGAGYVIFGGNFIASEALYLGTSGDDTLTGTATGERFEAGDGNDILLGRGGADVFQGDAGDDTILVPDLAFQSLDGGTGADILELTGYSNLDLDLGDFKGRITGIETIDLIGLEGFAGNQLSMNSLTLTLADLLSLSETTSVFTVNGNTNDHVIGLADDGWTDEGMDGNYHIYTNDGTTLRVDSDVNTDLPTRGVLSLANINGDNGFRLDSGKLVSNAGDVNGDGFDDVIVGAPRVKLNGGYSGVSYVVFGKASAFDASMNLVDLDGRDGFRLGGVYTYAAVSSAGDLNGDGFDDVIIGAPDGGYVVFGKASGFDATMNLSDIDGNDGFRLEGADPHFGSHGAVISDAGDINGDGFDDVIVGSPSAGPRYSSEYNYYSYGYGAGYVVFGKASAFSDVLDLASLDGTNGFRLDGAGKRNYAGASVSSAGDVNGDGFDDAIMGTSTGGYIVFGKAAGFDAAMNLSAIDGNNGFRLDGAVTHSPFAMSAIFSAAGDVNGDGFDDVIIGASDADPNGENSGSSYVVFGKASGFDAAMNLSNLDGNNGFRLDGAAREAFSGKSASTAGDVNGDGFDDLIVGAPGRFYDNPASYVVFGKASGFDAVMNLSSIVDNNGFRLEGVSGDRAGTSVSTAGDVNNDGFDDLIVGAPYADERSGASYVIFGKKNFAGEAVFSGTPGDDVLTGTTTAERFEAGNGNDIMIGRGGRDVFQGEDGDDIINVPDLDFQSLDGGTGTDILELSGAIDLNLDLANFRETIHGIETIDLDRFGSNTLTLTLQDLLSLSDTTNIFTIDGGGQVVGLKDGWLDEGMEGNYHIYTNSGTVLRVFSSITTDLPVRGVISLSELNGDNGFRLDGVSNDDESGYSVSNAGDVNGDGFDDVIIGAPYTDFGGNRSGSSYVVFGKASSFNATLDLASLDGNNGFRLDGLPEFDSSGRSVSDAGDVNGDGFDDLIVGAWGTDYVVFGKASNFDAAMNLSNLDGNNGFKLDGFINSSNAGDVNGDGFDDLIVGNPSADFNGNASGSSYVVFGSAFGFNATLDLASLNGNNGFRLDGASKYDGAGRSVSNAGDVNGDGFDDLIVGAFGTDSNGRAAPSSDYVVFGKASGFDAAMDLSTLDGSNGFRLINGVEKHSYLNASVSSAGDVNGDGFNDLIVGSSGVNQEGYNGGSYVVFGKATDFDAAMDLANLDGSNGFQLNSATSGFPSVAFSSAGDVNGDGFDDLIIGLPEASSYDGTGDRSGASYVMFGKASGFDAIVSLSSLIDNNGLLIRGVDRYDMAGNSVSGAGDINGDGFDDLIIGAPGADPNGRDSGSSYIIFGRSDFGGTNVTHPGTPGNDNLIGSSAADIFDAGDGNDNIIGRGGADVFGAGAGDDNIRVSDLNFQLVEGGAGNDALHLTGKDLNLDLNSLGGNIIGIETICLYGNGDNAVTLTAAGLINLSDSTNTLKVNGNAGDHIIGLSSGWADEGARGDGYFHAYTQGDAVLLVGANVTTDFPVV